MADVVSVIGSGSWGTAAAGLLATHCRQVRLWARSAEVAEAVNARHANPRHLRGYQLPPNVSATHDVAESVCNADALVLAVPSGYLRPTLSSFSRHVGPKTPVLVLTKGIEPGSHLLMTEVAAEILGNPERICALSGPNHAEEICRGMVSAAVVASANEEIARLFQGLFSCPTFRVYRSADLRGLEVCAAVKNVIAIACGTCVGLEMGDNAQAVLMTRGLAEIGRIVSAMGGSTLTCMGLAGMGDLVATCTSRHSRNRSFGEALAKGATLKGYEQATGMVVEGARAALSTWELSRERDVETPITNAVHAILYEGAQLDEVAGALLERRAHEEFYGLSASE